MFFEFCHECGSSISQPQEEGKMVVCLKCGTEIGIPSTPKPVMIDKSAELLKGGTAARCPQCQQIVQLKGQKTFVPHYAVGSKKICPQSGKSPS